MLILSTWKCIRAAVVAAALMIVSVMLPASTFAQSVIDGDGVAGWRVTLEPGQNYYFSSPEEACYAQWDYFHFSASSVYQGAVPTDGWDVFKCKWTGLPYPSLTQFFCDTGYTKVAPERCVKEVYPARPCNNCGDGVPYGTPNPVAGNPVEILTGLKMEKATDFSTFDGKLQVDRHYNALIYDPTALPYGVLRYGGIGWTFDFGPTIRLGTFSSSTGKTVAIFMADGTRYYFTLNTTTGQFVATDFASRDKATRTRFALSLNGPAPTNWADLNTGPSSWTLVDNFTGITYGLDVRLRTGATVYAYGIASSITHRGGYEWTLTYGSDNELVSVEDSFGRELTFTWYSGYGGAAGYAYEILADTIGLPDGTWLKYSYENYLGPMYGRTLWDRMTSVARYAPPSGGGAPVLLESTSYHYEDSRFPMLLTGITDARGDRYATWTYDGSGRILTSQHAGVDDVTLAYTSPNSSTRVRTVTNPLGRTSTYTFTLSTGDWLLQSVAGQLTPGVPASTTSFTYADKLVATRTDEEGRITRYTRDALGLPTVVERADGTPEERISTYTWRSDRQLDLAVEPGLTTDYAYDVDGLLSSVTQTDTTTHTVPYSTNGDTRTWAYTYTAEGLVASVDGPLPGTSDTIAYAYDADGYLETVTDELGHVTTILSVDDVGHPLQVEDANGIVTELGYDARGYLSGVTVDPGGLAQLTTLEYDEIGQLTRIERADGSSFDYAYSAARRLTSVTDASGNVVTYTHDDMGNATLTEIDDASSALVYAQAATFDELGRLLTQTGANSATWAFSYDKVSNLLETTDPRSNDVSQAYNGLNQVIATVDEANNAIDLTNDAAGNVISHVDPRLIETEYVRNGWGEVIQETSPDIGTVTYERNELGLVAKKTNGRGISSLYAYDQAGRQTAVSYPWSPGEDGYYTYDDTTGGNPGLGRLTGFGNAAGDTTFTYDGAGQVTTEALSFLGFSVATNYSYDDAGNIEEIVYPSGRVVTYTRDADGLLASVSTRDTALDPPTVLADQMEWMPLGDIRALSYGNGLDWERSYNTDYRLTQQTLSDGPTAILQKSYLYGDDLNLTAIEDDLDPSNDETYSYTATNRLETADGPWGDDTFGYDGVGNITSHVNDFGGVITDNQATYSPTANHMASIAQNGFVGRTFTYDANGNVKTDTIAGTTTEYFYNNADRMYALEQGGTQLGEYYYNLRGQLVLRIVTNTAPSGWYGYLYDQDGHLIAEHDASTGAPIREYVWLGDTPIAVIEAGVTPTISYIHPDHLNRPIALTDSTGDFVNETTWVAFGGTHVMSGSVGLDMRFPGQWYQHEGGLHYNWNRSYDPTIARYTQPDPLGLVDGPSRYAYVGSDPLQKVDPWGWTAMCPVRPPMGQSQWKPYVGQTWAFHCGFMGFLENREPVPEDPIAECFYDHQGTLVDENHKYCGCRGTPDQYPASDWWNHFWIDSGGVWAEGMPAWQQSRRYYVDRFRFGPESSPPPR